MSVDGFSETADRAHDPDRFVQVFRSYVDRRHFERLRPLRIVVQKQTIDAIQQNRFVAMENDEPVRIPLCTLDEWKEQVLGSRFENSEVISLDFDCVTREDTVVQVLNIDCLEAALSCLDEGLNPIVLSMANAHTCGGGFRNGCGAQVSSPLFDFEYVLQEENLFRRTSLFGALYDPHLLHPTNPMAERYPLTLKTAVYSPNIRVFRSSEATGYAFFRPKILSFVTAAAQNRPGVKTILRRHREPGGKFGEFDRVLGEKMYTSGEARNMLSRINTILLVAKKHRHDCVVLSAHGCGAFRNPPFHAACLFKLALRSDEFRGCFRRVVFAILEDHNSRHNLHGNYKPFNYVLVESGEAMVRMKTKDGDVPRNSEDHMEL